MIAFKYRYTLFCTYILVVDIPNDFPRGEVLRNFDGVDGTNDGASMRH